ncbi:sulfotransferase domain-containing protein [Chachezhania antarctica]|uniref:sulfotransferase domain-containing protein n=1 Tax=Chachezhania antarctica TaxID=2340860 RepID=UPI0013CF13BB|nr:sulfotransferase domain-containing protein [Chachezhania antarctica]|tara:strand:+ start:1669 stop:2445 length:777 start_codon:yes stop_codon:yes gene_type:complete
MEQPAGPKNYGILVACMPKSGSTFLSTMVASVPGFRKEKAVPSYRRREQELVEKELREAFDTTRILRQAIRRSDLLKQIPSPRGFVFQHHVKHNYETQNLIDQFGIVPVVLVRNLFDVVYSLRDHFAKESVFTPAAYVTEEMAQWEDTKMHAFIVDMAIPWYIHFYVSWYLSDEKLMLRYEDLVQDPAAVLKQVLDYSEVRAGPPAIKAAVEMAGASATRKNVGVAGRGEGLDEALKDKVRNMCAYYPDIDFSPIGIG